MTDERMTPELCCAFGKTLLFDQTASEADKRQGLRLILDAHMQKDPEATYLVARFLLDGILRGAGDAEEHALSLMCAAANSGWMQARTYLDAYCERRYAEQFGAQMQTPPRDGGLVDFDGKPIRIDRQGVLTPVDAVLAHEDGKNVLTLRTNLLFACGEEVAELQRFAEAVWRGIMAWQGEYVVFGGQQLSVRVELTAEDRLFDNLVIMTITEEISRTMQSAADLIGTQKKKELISNALSAKRSFATAGLAWTVNSRKLICIQSRSGKFDDYDEIMHVAKHEFGHVIGVGDLYCSPCDSLDGVAAGSYAELDSYAIADRSYNLVMCDHHGPIANNDIEMVVLAFRENRMQFYQPSRYRGKISKALGRGN